MRNNPSNPSTLDPYEKLSAAEKAAAAESEPVQGASTIDRDSKNLPLPPNIAVASGGTVEGGKADARSLSGRSSSRLPSLTVGSDTSEKLPLSALPEAYHPPLPAKPT